MSWRNNNIWKSHTGQEKHLEQKLKNKKISLQLPFRKRYTCQSPKSTAALVLPCRFTFVFCVCVCVFECACEQMGAGPLSRWTSVASLFIKQASATDSVTAAQSKVLNLRQSTVRELLKTLVTIHVNINKSRRGSEYWVPDKSDPS